MSLVPLYCFVEHRELLFVGSMTGRVRLSHSTVECCFFPQFFFLVAVTASWGSNAVAVFVIITTSVSLIKLCFSIWPLWFSDTMLSFIRFPIKTNGLHKKVNTFSVWAGCWASHGLRCQTPKLWNWSGTTKHISIVDQTRIFTKVVGEWCHLR